MGGRTLGLWNVEIVGIGAVYFLIFNYSSMLCNEISDVVKCSMHHFVELRFWLQEEVTLMLSI